ncbi:hypothetical protein QBC40DRAFT_251386 [Triangularia verruculosa]|uniref:Uncharacterized protein n=1 Tax=Triangularia verruculosa TaxID=2587418 RepID=A0AAN6XM46_9PEZI|nr:hypothetical protein QBC40DRAFT_251386 [Triangularia verruculosa]
MKSIAIIAFTLLPIVLSLPISNTTTSPSEFNAPCNFDIGDCASPLTCIPLSPTCTRWASLKNSWRDGCSGTCQFIDITAQKVYTKCGGWGLIDNCNERVEYCTADPRNDDCGPSCDGMGICQPNGDYCGGKEKAECREGLACFISRGHLQGDGEHPYGVCLPLRFGSDTYEKTRLEESWTEEWDGWQGDRLGL